ncbi:hypothetical protein WJX84_000089 [Apatococcus fuscideae]|uniref:Uncharacterized protein n=1 Tax=Apatococcus fuscideae TaxID=2026836 RepID=A0AAW1SS80_9CHLO
MPWHPLLTRLHCKTQRRSRKAQRSCSFFKFEELSVANPLSVEGLLVFRRVTGQPQSSPEGRHMLSCSSKVPAFPRISFKPKQHEAPQSRQ